MVFSSFEFLFLFLPLVLLGHGALPGPGLKNAWLLAASLAFFAWGEPGRLWILVAVGLWAWAWARLERLWRGPAARAALLAGLGGPLALLAWFKYASFIESNVARLWPGAPLWLEQHPALPLGISFFVFQAVAYTVDCRRGLVDARQPWHRVLLSLALFPQLVAGPIMRFRDLEGPLARRGVDWGGFGRGALLFCYGFSHKVLLADTLGRASEALYQDAAGLGAGRAWLAAVFYSLQLFLDFSGYSLMAMGLGRMIGFRFNRNFLYPYRALSVREFWRRWHITLSTWFRDYVYLPLGGNRRGAARTVVNLALVFLLCGLWHGAAWTFVAWGAFFGLLLILERLLPAWPAPAWLRRAYVLLAAVLAWTLFNAPDGPTFWDRLARMAGLLRVQGPGLPMRLLVPPHAWACLALALLAAFGAWPGLLRVLPARARGGLRAGAAALGLALSLAFLAVSQQQPFLYFRF